MPQRLQGIAQLLVDEALIEKEEALKTLDDAEKNKTSFVHYLVDKKLLGAAQIAKASSRAFGVPLLNLDHFDTSALPIELVSEDLIRSHNALPLLKRGHKLFVAVSDPSLQVALDEIKFHTGLNVSSVIVEADKLSKYIETALSAKETAALDDFLGDTNLGELDFSSDDGEASTEEESTESIDETPIVRFVHKVILDAVNKEASDIHFEPYENNYRVRFRVDGMLHEVAAPPVNLGSRIAARIKVMSSLDISERRIPQDGRFKMNLSRKHTIDFRVSTCPTVGGEKVVLRILNPTATNLGVESLGMDPTQKEHFLRCVNEPQGMLLVTGPTGSGKTITLYTALNILNTVEKNISTAEDPVEIKLTGVNQVNINTKTGLTFANALRSFLRQDPDIIMVGEMRDLETAEIGIKAAQTGHLVLSTLHTNSAPETLTRLANMGVLPFNIATSTSLIVAQRLARKLCEHCKKPADIPEEVMRRQGFQEADIGSLELFQAEGCSACTAGYKGRIGLFEVMPISKQIANLIMTGKTSLEIANEARSEGMMTIRESGLEKVKAGLTSLEEINRVTKD